VNAANIPLQFGSMNSFSSYENRNEFDNQHLQGFGSANPQGVASHLGTDVYPQEPHGVMEDIGTHLPIPFYMPGHFTVGGVGMSMSLPPHYAQYGEPSDADHIVSPMYGYDPSQPFQPPYTHHRDTSPDPKFGLRGNNAYQGRDASGKFAQDGSPSSPTVPHAQQQASQQGQPQQSQQASTQASVQQPQHYPVPPIGGQYGNPVYYPYGQYNPYSSHQYHFNRMMYKQPYAAFPTPSSGYPTGVPPTSLGYDEASYKASYGQNVPFFPGSLEKMQPSQQAGQLQMGTSPPGNKPTPPSTGASASADLAAFKNQQGGFSQATPNNSSSFYNLTSGQPQFNQQQPQGNFNFAVHPQHQLLQQQQQPYQQSRSQAQY
jgi:hypothetical protein